MKAIKRSIDESDVFILILGGFYGLMLRDESMSYTHWEYEYAGEVGKLVVGEHYQRLQEFKQSVFENIPTYYAENEQHIKMVIRDQLPEYARRDDLYGWISGKDVPDVQKLLEENASLLRENAK